MKLLSRRKGTVEHGEDFGWRSGSTVTGDISYGKAEGQDVINLCRILLYRALRCLCLAGLYPP